MTDSVSAIVSRLESRADELRAQWRSRRLFGYFVCDNFLPEDVADRLLACYPEAQSSVWDHTTYTHQRKKFQLRSGFAEPIERFFNMTGDVTFLGTIASITGIEGLVADPQLVGGGLHQSIRGAFLDVHVDFNVHPQTKYLRRLNLLLYLNKNWKREYEGYLELWDMAQKRKLDEIAPIFNRAVLFETNEVSFHGHPHPLSCPDGMSRKSLAVYYYTPPVDAVAMEHSTLYRQTTGASGYAKTIVSGLHAARERLNDGRLGSLFDNLQRRLRGLPPRQRL